MFDIEKLIKYAFDAAKDFCIRELKYGNLSEDEGADLRGRINGLRIALGFFAEIEELRKRKENSYGT